MSGYLIDENLPAGLASLLGSGCRHAVEIGRQVSDQTLWEYAKNNDLVILTKDADFFEKLVIHGSPPRVVWVRTGNLRRLELEDLLRRQWPRIVLLLEGADLIEVHETKLEAIKF